MSEEKNDLTQVELGSATVEEDHGPIESTETVDKKRKKLKVMGADNYGMYYVGFENGGELPKKFKNSKWTTLRDVQEVVDSYNRGL